MAQNELVYSWMGKSKGICITPSRKPLEKQDTRVVRGMDLEVWQRGLSCCFRQSGADLRLMNFVRFCIWKRRMIMIALVQGVRGLNEIFQR